MFYLRNGIFLSTDEISNPRIHIPRPGKNRSSQLWSVFLQIRMKNQKFVNCEKKSHNILRIFQRFRLNLEDRSENSRKFQYHLNLYRSFDEFFIFFRLEKRGIVHWLIRIIGKDNRHVSRWNLRYRIHLSQQILIQCIVSWRIYDRVSIKHESKKRGNTVQLNLDENQLISWFSSKFSCTVFPRFLLSCFMLTRSYILQDTMHWMRICCDKCIRYLRFHLLTWRLSFPMILISQWTIPRFSSRKNIKNSSKLRYKFKWYWNFREFSDRSSRFNRNRWKIRRILWDFFSQFTNFWFFMRIWRKTDHNWEERFFPGRGMCIRGLDISSVDKNIPFLR